MWFTNGNRSSNHRVEPAALEGTVEVCDDSLDVLRPLASSAFGRFEILDAELDLLGVVARLAEGHHAAEVVVAGAIRAISPPSRNWQVSKNMRQFDILVI